MKEASITGDSVSVGLVAAPSSIEVLTAPYFIYDVSCIDENGEEKWREHFRNVVTAVGKTFLLETVFRGSGYTAAWFMSLIGNTSYTGAPVVGDTLATHGTWTEQSGYTGGPTRKTLTFNAAGAGSISHTAVSFTGVADTINGCFVCTASTGTSGTLYSAGAFSSARVVTAPDTLNVTVTLTIS
jgi:hypothetical protein